MARRRYFRYPRRTVAKKKWASNLKGFSLTSATDTWSVLVENKAQANAPTPTIIKAGNFKIQGDCNYDNVGSGIPDLSCVIYILFVPEGWADADIGKIQTQHPEWIMGWSVIDFPYAQSFASGGGNKFSLSTRLKRNLNSGDKIVVYFGSSGTITSDAELRVHGIAQYWTCAN